MVKCNSIILLNAIKGAALIYGCHGINFRTISRRRELSYGVVYGRHMLRTATVIIIIRKESVDIAHLMVSWHACCGRMEYVQLTPDYNI